MHFQQLRDQGHEGIKVMLRDIFMGFLKKADANAGVDMRVEIGVGPPRTETLCISPINGPASLSGIMNPTDSPSGEKNGLIASSVPGMACAVN